MAYSDIMVKTLITLCRLQCWGAGSQAFLEGAGAVKPIQRETDPEEEPVNTPINGTQKSELKDLESKPLKEIYVYVQFQ